MRNRLTDDGTRLSRCVIQLGARTHRRQPEGVGLAAPGAPREVGGARKRPRSHATAAPATGHGGRLRRGHGSVPVREVLVPDTGRVHGRARQGAPPPEAAAARNLLCAWAPPGRPPGRHRRSRAGAVHSTVSGRQRYPGAARTDRQLTRVPPPELTSALEARAGRCADALTRWGIGARGRGRGHHGEPRRGALFHQRGGGGSGGTGGWS